MSEKQDDAADKKKKIDFDAFELQIDQEIDSLFIPAGQAAPDPGQSALVEQETKAPPPPPAPELKPEAPPAPAPKAAPEVRFEVPPAPAPEASRPPAPELPKSPDAFHQMIEQQSKPEAPAFGGGKLELEINQEIDRLFNAEVSPAPTPQAPPPPAREPVPDIVATGQVKTEAILSEPVFELPQEEAAPAPVAPAPVAPAAEAPAAKAPELKASDFELQLDQEIDSLFVPSGPIPPPLEEKPAAPEFKFEIPATDVKAPEPAPPAAAVEPPAPKAQEFDLLGDLKLEEILPAVEPRKSEPVPFKPVAEEKPPAVEEAKPAPEWFKPAPEAPAIVLEPEVSVEPEAKVEAAPAAEAGEQEESELSALLDAFKIAYLSLDWEFSVENISSLQSSLGSLGPYCRKSAGANSIYKILKVVLERLKTKPHAINPQLIEMVRDAQELLKPILLKEGHLDRQEKEKVKNLIGRFQSMRDKGAMEKAPITSRIAEEEGVPEEVAAAAPLPVLPEDQLVFVETRPISAFKEWLESARARTEEAVQGLEFENHRLEQIEQILSKTKALGPLVERLSGIRANVGSQIAALKSKDSEWDDRLRWLKDLEVTISSRGEPMPAPIPLEEAVELEEVVLEAEPAEERGYEAVFGAEGDTRPGQVMYFTLGGKKFAVLASQVVKIDKVAAAKVKKFFQRGYASLADFKPMFKNLKAGLFGTWAGLPLDVLKGYRFVPIPGEVFGVESLSARSGGAILLSSGKRHGILFCDSPVVDLHNDVTIVIGKARDERMLGSIMGVDDTPVEVLNLDRTISNLV